MYIITFMWLVVIMEESKAFCLVLCHSMSVEV